ncbi:TRAP transporter small permease [Sinirhodobacter huangdaonensis]|uniref:TRAP transporter small permease protein n=1 Tax=Paenirhodobacter huangdaonensis TaxID=2501515 RepID=A0A3S3LI63_9RHOB|nr:TRAP transporter small permease [Sinirhodobacter huangdaonensis]
MVEAVTTAACEANTDGLPRRGRPLREEQDLRHYLRLLDQYLEDAFSAILYIYIIAIIFAEVVGRYVFKSSMLFAYETAIYAFIWLSYLSMAAMARNRAHLAVTFLRDMMPRSIQLVLLLLSDVLLIVLASVVVVFIRQPLADAIDFEQMMVGIDLPFWIALLSVPVGWSLVVLRTIQRSIATISDYRNGRALALTTAAAAAN